MKLNIGDEFYYLKRDLILDLDILRIKKNKVKDFCFDNNTFIGYIFLDELGCDCFISENDVFNNKDDAINKFVDLKDVAKSV